MAIHSVWKESVSARAMRLRLPIEHFVGYSLQCKHCEDKFRSFREFEPYCGACRSLVR